MCRGQDECISVAPCGCTPSLTLIPQNWVAEDKLRIIPGDPAELGAHGVPGDWASPGYVYLLGVAPCCP